MPDAEPLPPPTQATEAPKKSGAVLRNTLILVGGQLAGVPLSILLSATMGRYLGAEDFGYIYLAGTLTSFGFLLVESGQNGRTDRIFLTILLLAILGIVSDAVVGVLERFLLKRWS